MSKLGLFLLVLVGFNFARAADSNQLNFVNGALVAELAWERGPLVGKESLLRIQWHRADGTPCEPGGTFEVNLDMPMMGHGSVPTQIATGEQTGAYKISSLYFLMAGDWNVQVILHPVSGSEQTEYLTVHLAE